MDIHIRFNPGDSIGLLRPLTKAGQSWLVDNVRRDCPRGSWANKDAIMAVEELLPFLERTAAERPDLQLHWLKGAE